MTTASYYRSLNRAVIRGKCTAEKSEQLAEMSYSVI